jgi:heptosyltransferase-2
MTGAPDRPDVVARGGGAAMAASGETVAREPQRILVRAPNWVGDVVMATPAFRALRTRFPRAEITVQVRDALAPLLAGAPWFDARLDVLSHRRGLRATLAEGRALRTHRFDLGICLPDSVSSALLMRAAGVREVVGHARGLRGLLLHRAVEPARGAEGGRWVARERQVLALAAAVDARSDDTKLELFTTAAEEQEAVVALAAAGVSTGEGLVALAPGAAYGPSKCWPPEHFARLAEALSGRGLRAVLVGAPSEREASARVVAAASPPPVDLTGRISLGALKAVLRRVRALVCNDAGARHVAVAFGVPVVCLFGPTSLAKTNLNLEQVAVLAADVGCRPCYHRDCPTDHRCMTRIEPERVAKATLRILAPGAGAPA